MYLEDVRLKGCWLGASGCYEQANDSYVLVTGNISISRRVLMQAVG
jgi:hypothetical protein